MPGLTVGEPAFGIGEPCVAVGEPGRAVGDAGAAVGVACAATRKGSPRPERPINPETAARRRKNLRRVTYESPD